MEVLLGCHVSFTKDMQLLGSLEEAISYGGNTFMFYTGAPQNTVRTPIDLELTGLAQQKMRELGIDIDQVIVHAPYIVNLANDQNNYEFAIDFLKQEISRCEMLGISKMVLHPGSYTKLTKEQGIANIIRALNIIIDSKTKVMVLLETMAGKGTECGSSFEDMKKMIDGIKYQDKIGVCLDTCHIHDAGYSLECFDEVLKQFDEIIGLKYLKCVHINDSKNELGAHKDRHENFGFGAIGFESLLNVVYHETLKDVPKILETPYVTKDDNSKERMYPPYKFEMEMIRQKKFDPMLIDKIRAFYK